MTHNLRSPSYEQFLEYRAVIIKAIARAWRDPAYRHLLKENPIAALKTLGYSYPFKIKLKVQTDTSKWTPGANGGWTTCRQNKLTLVLPPAPAKKEDYAIALASYNANHIDIMDHHSHPGD
jgi:ribosomally synthesized peptide (two-chain TOMM family)